MKGENLVDGKNLTEYRLNKLQHEKCFLRHLRTRCFCITKLTRLLRSLVLFLYVSVTNTKANATLVTEHNFSGYV